MKRLKLFIVIFIIGLFSISLTKKLKTIYLKSKYSWQYTFTENEVMLIKQKNVESHTSRIGEEYIAFTGNQFKEVRTPGCGNDIAYNKTGTYTLNSKQMILNYSGGVFSDNVGGDSMQAYVKGKVYYNVNRISSDTVFLTRIKGMSTKKMARKK